MEKVHPNLYYSADKTEMLQEVERIKNSITAPMSRLDFYKLAAPLVPKLNDGHTVLNFPYEVFQKYLVDGGKVFTYNIQVKDKSIIMTNTTRNTPLVPMGAEINTGVIDFRSFSNFDKFDEFLKETFEKNK